MKKPAMEEKLVVRPIVGCLIHTHFWEGPCRAGHAEDMTKEAEAAAADRYFAQMAEELKKVTPEAELMPMVDARYTEKFVVSEEVYAEIEKDMEIWGSKEPPADYPVQKGFGAPDPTSYDFLYTYFEDGEFRYETKEDKYWLKGDNLPGYLENYELHRAKEGEEQKKWKV